MQTKVPREMVVQNVIRYSTAFRLWETAGRSAEFVRMLGIGVVARTAVPTWPERTYVSGSSAHPLQRTRAG
ncbi:hypothetical protein ACG96_23410 [Rhodococcoides fascians]|nr:hypothetical protein ACG96_23410 [Rhodococcus fascians]